MEGDPAVSGRWGPSVVLLPAGDVASSLDDLTRSALAAAGPGHWATGSAGAAHATVRALQRWGGEVTPSQVVALERAAEGTVTLALRGIKRTDTAVLLLAAPADDAADRLRARYAEELGADGWLEDEVLPPPGRTGWYLTLVHFDAPVSSSLDDWVAAHAEVDLGAVTIDAVHACRWQFDPVQRRMLPESVATVPLR